MTPPPPPTPPTRPTRSTSRGLSVLSPAEVEERKGIVSVLSGNERSGVWSLPRRLRVVAVFGAARLDLRQARVAPGETEVEVFALCGHVTIIVPPEMRVECDVDTLAAGVELRGLAEHDDATGTAPTLRVHGTATAASVDIEVRELGDDLPFHSRKRRRELERNRRDRERGRG